MSEQPAIAIDGQRIPLTDFHGTLADVLADLGHPLNTRCHQRGLCKGCMVFVNGELTKACLHRAADGQSIQIPARSRLSHPPAVVDDFRTGVSAGCAPLFNRRLGLAVDIGTTTVAALLVEMESGNVLARASSLNAQVARGDNVLTRIQICQEDPSNIGRLKDDFWRRTFDPLAETLFRKSGATWEETGGLVVAGNTTMLHLATGTDPTPMGRVPFTPGFLDIREETGDAFGLASDIRVILLPGLSAFVGADIVAGAVCCGAIYREAPTLLVDIGTNGEILLCSRDGNLACATAAGPAFEGSGLLCGSRAEQGVISHLRIHSPSLNATWNQIGPPDLLPHGIAGSGYIDFLAEARSAGLLTETGRFSDEARTCCPRRFQREDHGWSYLLDVDQPSLRVGEVDVALLLQAKAAIAAGVETLLRIRGLSPDQIETVYLAGGFGLHMSISNALTCGLLPGFAPSQIQTVGNTSLGGACLALLDRTFLAEMAALRAQTVELNRHPEFEDRYLDHLALV